MMSLPSGFGPKYDGLILKDLLVRVRGHKICRDHAQTIRYKKQIYEYASCVANHGPLLM